MIGVVKIREFNPGSNSYREKRGNERQILLRDFFHWDRSWTRESTVEVNYRKRRLRGKYAAFGHDFVSLGLNRRRMRFRKFYAAFDEGACQKRDGHDGKHCVKPQQPAEAHFARTLAAFHQSESICGGIRVHAIRLLGFWPSGSNCRDSEENRGDHAPEYPNGTGDTETGERRVLRKGERPKPAHRSQARKQDRL